MAWIVILLKTDSSFYKWKLQGFCGQSPGDALWFIDVSIVFKRLLHDRLLNWPLNVFFNGQTISKLQKCQQNFKNSKFSLDFKIFIRFQNIQKISKISVFIKFQNFNIQIIILKNM
jgi:hypothetical protein